MVAQREKPLVSASLFKQQLKERRASVCRIGFLVCIEERRRGIPRQVVGAAIARAIMKSQPSLVPLYQGFVEARLEAMYGTSWISGSEVVTLLFAAEARQTIVGHGPLVGSMNEELKGWCRVEAIIDPAQVAGCTLTFASPFKSDPGEACRQLQLKYTLLKKSHGHYEYSFAPQSIRKNIVAALGTREVDGQTTLWLEPGSKFDLGQFLALAFKDVEPENRVRIGIGAEIRLKG